MCQKILNYRFEPDMLAFSGCYYGGGEKERYELGEIRKRWATLPVRLLFLMTYFLLLFVSVSRMLKFICCYRTNDQKVLMEYTITFYIPFFNWFILLENANTFLNQLPKDYVYSAYEKLYNCFFHLYEVI